MRSSSPIPMHDDTKCRMCRICWNQCPAETLAELRSEEDTLRGVVYSSGRGKGTGPRSSAPCMSACPLKQDVPEYVSAVARRDYTEALRVIRLTNPLPRVLARLCEHPCTKACTRGAYDRPVEIRGLKLFAARAVSDPGSCMPDKQKTTGMKVAIIGAGPAGLAAAYALALKGHSITMFESAGIPGGLLRQAVPGFLLPAHELDRDIEEVVSLGVRLECNVSVGKDVELEHIAAEHDAVVVATGAGAQGPTRLLSDDTRDRVVSGIQLMRDVASGRRPDLGRRVAVVGGYPEGLACARTALRLGAKEVRLVFSAKLDRLPGPELDAAEEEGVLVCAEHLVQGLEQEGPDLALNLNRTTQGLDEALTILCDTVIVAQGRIQDLSFSFGLDSPDARLVDPTSADKRTLALGRRGFFAAGEAAMGPKSTVRAVASGLKAASAVHEFLSSEANRE